MAGILLVLFAIVAAVFSQQPQSEKPNEPVITIERTGGFAGVEDRVSIFADGKVIDETGRVRHVQASSLEGFIRSVKKVSVPAGSHRYCSDCFMYAIRIRGGEAGKTFFFGEPIQGSSANESDAARIIRDFLSVIFSFRNKG